MSPILNASTYLNSEKNQSTRNLRTNSTSTMYYKVLCVCGGERGVDMGVSGIKTVYKLNIVILTIIINIKLIHMHGKKI